MGSFQRRQEPEHRHGLELPHRLSPRTYAPCTTNPHTPDSTERARSGQSGRVLGRRRSKQDPRVDRSEPERADGPARGLPSALVELLLRYFGDLALPNYSAALTIVQRDPYRPLRNRLADAYDLHDSTDLQYDLGWSWWFHEPNLNVRVSFIGPFAVVLDRGGRVVRDVKTEAILAAEGFVVLDEQALSVPVEIWAPEVEGPLYEFLFEFDKGLPWAV